jgi:branched-subunit amino acid ABC-type transport system permease component
VPASFAVAGAVGMAPERASSAGSTVGPLETLLATWGISLMPSRVRTIFGAQNVQVENSRSRRARRDLWAWCFHSPRHHRVCRHGARVHGGKGFNRTRLGLFVRAEQ